MRTVGYKVRPETDVLSRIPLKMKTEVIGEDQKNDEHKSAIFVLHVAQLQTAVINKN